MNYYVKSASTNPNGARLFIACPVSENEPNENYRVDAKTIFECLTKNLPSGTYAELFRIMDFNDKMENGFG